MNRSSFYTAAAAGLFLTPLAIANPQTSGAAPDPTVTVDNTAANPVPVSVIGTASVTGSVTLANQPTVDARQSGAWMVGISGTPTVAIDGTPTVAISGTPSVSLAGTAAVTIANGAASPALVRDVGDGRELYQRQIGGLLAQAYFNGCLASFVVPAGRRLIVQQVTAEISTDEPELIAALSITGGTNSDYVSQTIPLQRNTPTSRYLVASQALLAYGAPGQTACLWLRRVSGSPAGDITGSYTITGYTVPAP